MNPRLLSLLVASSCVTLASTALAGHEAKDYKKIINEPCPPDTLNWFTARSSYTGESDFKRGNDAKGDSWYKEFEYNHRILLGPGWPNAECGNWYARIGLNYTRWDFSNDGNLPLPNTLQSFSLPLALEYVVNDEAAIMLETRPGLYFEQDIDSEDFDAPTKIYGAYFLAKNEVFSLAVVAGASYTGFRSYQFIPAVGFVLHAGKWTVRAVVPEPRIFFQATDSLNFWVGAELAGGSFRTDGHDFRRKEQLNEAVVTYSEWRAEAGFSYKVANCTLDVGAGYAFERKFDFHRADQGYSTNEGAPFVKVELRTGF